MPKNVFRKNYEEQKPIEESRQVHQSDVPYKTIKNRHVDGIIVETGLAADKPDGASHVKGWFATDTTELFFWDGSAWKEITSETTGDARYLMLDASNDPITDDLDIDANLSIRNQNELRFYDNGNYVGFEAPALTANQIWILPDADGSANDFLQTNGSGTLSWAAAVTAPAGSTKQVQYNNAGAFGGAAGFEYQAGASPNVLIQSQDATYVPLIVKGAASQSGSLLQLHDNSGNTLIDFDANGHLTITPQTDATDTVEIQDSSSNVVFTIDTSNRVAGFNISNPGGFGYSFVIKSLGAAYAPFSVANSNAGGSDWSMFDVVEKADGYGQVNMRHFGGTAVTILDVSDGNFIGVVDNTKVALTIQGFTAPTGDLLNVKKYGGTSLFTIEADGDVVIGNGTADKDYTLTFNGETNDGVLTWMEDEDYFKFGDDIMMADGENIVFDTTTGTQIGTATSQKLGFFGVTPVVQQTELTDELTTITHTAPGTPDYAIQDFVDIAGDGSLGFSFANKDEANTVLSVIANLQTRQNELETKLVALGLLADAD